MQPDPTDRPALRRRLIAERRALSDRPARDAAVADHLAAELDRRPDRVVGAYWPIRGEFDPLAVLTAWRAASAASAAAASASAASAPRRIGLPVVDAASKRMRFHEWWPGCPMAEDAYGIPEPAGTPTLEPTLLIVPCVGFGPGGIRLGYGGGFYDRMLATVDPRPATIGVAYAGAFVPDLGPGEYDIPLDAILTEEGLVPRIVRRPIAHSE